MKRSTLPPDTRPDWRDPAMPVDRKYVGRDGKPMGEITPEYESGFRAFLIETMTQLPNWRNDPTYDLKRKR